jgi:O-antigen ligase
MKRYTDRELRRAHYSGVLPMARTLFLAMLFFLPFVHAIPTPVPVNKAFGLACLLLCMTQMRFILNFPRASIPFYLYWIIAMVWASFLYPEFLDESATHLFKFLWVLGLCWVCYVLCMNKYTYQRVVFTVAFSIALLVCMRKMGLAPQTSRAVEVWGTDRVTAFGFNPNEYAFIVGIGVLCMLHQVQSKSRRFLPRIVTGVLLLVLLQEIFLTGSRGTGIALVASLPMLALRGKSIGANVRNALLVCGLIIFAYGVVLNVPATEGRWENFLLTGDTTHRGDIWVQAMKMFEERPWLGWGPGQQAHELWQRIRMHFKTAQGLCDTHNNILWVLTEVGLLGAIPFLLGCVIFVYKAWQARHSSMEVLPLQLCVFVLINGLSVTNFFDEYFWIAAGLAFAGARMRPPIQDHNDDRLLRSRRAQSKQTKISHRNVGTVYPDEIIMRRKT